MDAATFTERFVKEMVEALGANLKSIILCGSYARGDHTEESDMDLYCFCEQLTPEDLLSIGKIIERLPALSAKFECNVQCMTMDEYARQGFGRAFVTPIKFFESKVLFGEDWGGKPTREDFYPIFENIIADAVMSIRHYMTAQEPAQQLADGRLKRWVLKPLCVALRIERYIITGNYPYNFKELAALSTGLPQTQAVEWIQNNEVFTQTIRTAPTEVLVTLLSIATGVSARVTDYRLSHT